MSFQKIIELKRERKSIFDEATKLRQKIEGEEKREMTTEERQKYDRMFEDIEKKSKQIEDLEREMNVQSRVSGDSLEDAGGSGMSDEERKEKVNGAFRSFLKHGISGMGEEERQIMAERFGPVEGRAQSAGTGSEGGYTVPEGFYNRIIEAMKAYGGMRESRATILRTATGNDLPMPTINDTGNIGAILGENTQVGEQDVTFAQKTLGAYTYTSKLIRVSLQLLQDSAFDMEAFLARILAERIGRATNAHFTTGTGTSQPEGIVTGSAAGLTAAATGAVTYAELMELKHAVNRAYRQNAQWMFNDNTLLAIKKLTDGNSRPLWSPGIAAGEPDRFDGDRYVVNDDMADMATSSKPIIYGDFSAYFIRDVLGIQLLRLNERYADYLQVGFLAFSRHDGLLADAGTNPVKHIAMAAA